ncbi:hypothetical protein K504DRAFT_400446, partial [Pleomassaria siparia CBS 279.74]
MTSSKGKPTDPKLREKVKEDVKAETNKDGGGKGQWSAWKAAKLSKEYEKKGGDYENEPGSKNEPVKGTPQPKAEGGTKSKEDKEEKDDDSAEEEEEGKEKDKEVKAEEKQTPKANIGAKKSKSTGKTGGEPATKTGAANTGTAKTTDAKKEKPIVEGSRKSARVAEKRDGDGEEQGREKK